MGESGGILRRRGRAVGHSSFETFMSDVRGALQALLSCVTHRSHIVRIYGLWLQRPRLVCIFNRVFKQTANGPNRAFAFKAVAISL